MFKCWLFWSSAESSNINILECWLYCIYESATISEGCRRVRVLTDHQCYCNCKIPVTFELNSRFMAPTFDAFLNTIAVSFYLWLDSQWRHASNPGRQTLRWVNKESDATLSSSLTRCDETWGFLMAEWKQEIQIFVCIIWMILTGVKWKWTEIHWSEESVRWQKERKTPASSAQLWITITRL